MAGGVPCRAPAKINLALHITGRRPDGYHELDSLVVFADFGDDIAVEPCEDLSLVVGGPFAHHAPDDGRNLALAAARLLRDTAGLRKGAAIRLVKHIPAGAGFGGGSGDAAAVLRALNALWDCRLAEEDLVALGLKLGADVPMCVYGRTLRARGVGETIEPASAMPPLPLVLVWPGEPVATPGVFARLRRRRNAALPDPWRALATVDDVAFYLAACRNDLEEAAIAMEPAIVGALASLRATPGCLLARMSGSGSGCFGLYRTTGEADTAASALREEQPNWWIVDTLAGGQGPRSAFLS